MGRITRTGQAAAPVWVPCPACWGQGRIYCRDEDRRLRPVTCYGCLGVGQALPVPADPPAAGGPAVSG